MGNRKEHIIQISVLLQFGVPPPTLYMHIIQYIGLRSRCYGTMKVGNTFMFLDGVSLW